MHKERTITLLLIIAAISAAVQAPSFARQVKTNYVNAFADANHPQIVYWFFKPNMLAPKAYKAEIDNFVRHSKYTMAFLTARDGVNFYDVKKMHPIFKNLVAYAHEKGLKIGLQIWKSDAGTLLKNTERLIQEGEVTLDKNGRAVYGVKATGARDMSQLIKSELFRIYLFKETSPGFYDPSTLRNITRLATAKATSDSVSVSIDAGSSLAGYTAYIMTEHYYNSCSNFSRQAIDIITNAFKAYGDIPFDGIGLDEYKNLKIAREPVLKKTHTTFRERVYSLGMARRMKTTTGRDLTRVLFDMRFAPEGRPQVRIRAINEYMSLLRTATLGVERAMYETGKRLFGKNAFIGLHDTFHNNLDEDEVWQTGVSWWNIRRDCGFTDEETPAAIQLGIGMCYKSNVMYNMFNNRSLHKLWSKALYDDRYGIRTLYHAANDNGVWGVSVDKPDVLAKINPVEDCTRLLNRFNPPFPDVKILVVYGMEALFDWYPNAAQRGLYDINDKLGMQNKSVEMWKAGYLNASVPSDVIEDGRLRLNPAGKPTLNGHVFDAIVYLYPQYSKEKTVRFLRSFVERGGKLMLVGNVTRDYYGKDIRSLWKEKVGDKAVATGFSLVNVAKLGVSPDTLVDGVSNGDGSFTFTSIRSLQYNEPVNFSFEYHGNVFSGSYEGMAAIKVNNRGEVVKLAARKFGALYRNGKKIMYLSRPADLFLHVHNGRFNATVADSTRSVKLYETE